MNFYNFGGFYGKIKLRTKLLNSWILHSLAYHSIYSPLTISLQRKRGIKIKENSHIAPYVIFDLIFPHLIEIHENVSIGSNTMIFSHSNPTANPILKEKYYPRKIDQVVIKKGAWINPGCIIGPGVTIGENSVLSVGTVITTSVPDNCVVAGNPGRIVKKLD